MMTHALAVALSLAGQAAPATPPTIDTSRPFLSDMNYPPAALRARAEGTVVMDLAISARGRVTGCTIVEGSGSEPLDTASCRMARSLPVRAARDANGKTVSGTLRHRQRWTLPDRR